jgi:hypothetical protein
MHHYPCKKSAFMFNFGFPDLGGREISHGPSKLVVIS